MTNLGIALIVITVGLFIAELFTGSGYLLIGGLISLIIGLAILIGQGVLVLSWWFVALIFILLIGLTVFIVLRVIHAHRNPPITGKEDLVGKTAKVKEKLDPEGTVFYQGDYWNAISETGKIDAGEEVIINKIDGLTLYVSRKPKINSEQ